MSRHPDHDFVRDRPPTPTEQAALEWVVCSDRGMNVRQQRAFMAWIDAEPEHRELFEEFGGTWTLMQHAAERASARPEETPTPVTKSALPAYRSNPTTRRARWQIWLPLAAAAAIAVAVIGQRHRERDEVSVATEIGGSRQVTLADGSVVSLNTDSAVVTSFSASERRVRLTRGEAFFQVAKDAGRPFLVEASGVGVRALGTAFNVRVRSESVEVLVTEGTVRVGAETSPQSRSTAVEGPMVRESTMNQAALFTAETSSRRLTDVTAGERISIPVGRKTPIALISPAMIARVAADEVSRTLAWQGRRLDFADTPLAEILMEFNRYNRQPLAAPDPRLAAMKFGGSFRSDDRAGFVRMLQENFGITAEERDGQTVLRPAR